MNSHSLKPKHVNALVADWHARQLTAGTIAQYLAALRWWAEKVNKSNVLHPNNSAYLKHPKKRGFDVSRAIDLTPDTLAKIVDPHLRLSLRLQAQFGLRREEALLFRVSYADRGDHIQLKGSWTKGGRPRSIPVWSAEQRALLVAISAMVGSRSLIPTDRRLEVQRKRYERQTWRAGLRNPHGLRHGWAQRRYRQLAGWPCPAAGGPQSRELTGDLYRRDQEARLQVSQELGHNRIEITRVYLG